MGGASSLAPCWPRSVAVYHRGVNPRPGLITIQAVLLSLDFIVSVETVLSLGKDWGQEGGYNIKMSEMIFYASNETHVLNIHR